MWPLPDRYNSAIHKPDSCFADSDLRGTWPTRDRRGLPAPASGAFGCVYEMRGWQHTWAVKCFIREVQTSEWRYTEVSAYIKAHPSPFLVACDYLVPHGILVDGRWYPVLKMDWVAGKTLDRFVEEHLDAPELLAELANSWVEAMAALAERGMAHGDLQHGNALVSMDGKNVQLKLVDYDNMYVPAFAGEEGEESGLRDYQHPRRTGHDFNDRVDNFAALGIYISLRAAALQPEIWKRYHVDDNLLFKRQDYDRPEESPLLADLHALPDAALVTLVDAFRAACHDENPCSLGFLAELVRGTPARTAPAAVLPAPAVPTRAPGPAFPRPATAPADTDLPLICPHCKTGNRMIAKYCRNCALALPYTGLPSNGPLPLQGIPLVTLKVCPWCGFENQGAGRWCMGCGALLD